MSTAYKCDRCQILFEGSFSLDVRRSTSVGRRPRLFLNLTQSSFDGIIPAHFCSECSKLLQAMVQEWWDFPSNEGESE